MLRGRLRAEPGYVETWGTFKGVLEVEEEGAALVVSGRCTDIVELYSWLLPTIASNHPDKEILLGDITIPDTEVERELLKHEVRLFLEDNSDRMQRVEPTRLADGPATPTSDI